ncbi:MAG: ABC transporter permease subunit [Acidilobaceae archaeon]
MRIATFMLILSIILAFQLNLIDPKIIGLIAVNSAKLIPELGIRVDMLGEALKAVYETLIMSLFGVSTGTLIAYILAPLASPLIAPPSIATTGRLLANTIRTIPAILWAILFVILVGPGPRAGALALSIYTAAYLIKFFYEALESTDREHYDALRVMGLKGLPLALAIYTHIRRQIVSSILFMLEYNVRTATILGFVGAGGVGYYILQYLNLLNYQATMTFVLVTLILVIIIDLLSYIIRTRI